MPPDEQNSVTKTFMRFRYVVEVVADPAAITEQIALPNPRIALQSEIRTNLESLDGVRRVTVEPAT